MGDLVARYKETRRSHPLAADGRILDGIKLERELLAPLKKLEPKMWLIQQNSHHANSVKPFQSNFSSEENQVSFRIESDEFWF